MSIQESDFATAVVSLEMNYTGDCHQNVEWVLDVMPDARKLLLRICPALLSWSYSQVYTSPSSTSTFIKYGLIAGCCSFLEVLFILKNHLVNLLLLSSHILCLKACLSSSRITHFKQGLLPQVSASGEIGGQGRGASVPSRQCLGLRKECSRWW